MLCMAKFSKSRVEFRKKFKREMVLLEVTEFSLNAV